MLYLGTNFNKKTIFVLTKTYPTNRVMNKFLAFEYLICLFIEWYQEVKTDEGYKQSFSKLTVLKLLFFTAATQNPEDENSDLLDTFGEFFALPHGPVETDIYSRINLFNDFFNLLEDSNSENHFTIGNNGISVSQPNKTIEQIKSELAENIDPNDINSLVSSLNLLKSKNDQLVTYDPFTLVDISHKWTCWKTSFNTAKILGKRSQRMSIDNIRKSDKYYI